MKNVPLQDEIPVYIHCSKEGTFSDDPRIIWTNEKERIAQDIIDKYNNMSEEDIINALKKIIKDYEDK